MDRSRKATLALLARIPPEDIVRPGTQGDWSIKDVLAHFAAWEDEGTERLRLIRHGRADRIRYFDDLREADAFNANAVRAVRSVSLPGILRRLARARLRLHAAVRRVPASALRDPSHRYPVTVWLPEFAWAHEEGHVREIRAWWARSRRWIGR